MKRFATMGIILATGLVFFIGASGRNPSTPEASTKKEFVKEGPIDLMVIIAIQADQTYVAYKEPVKAAPAVENLWFSYNLLSFVKPLCKQSLGTDPVRRRVIQKNKGPTIKLYAELGNSIAYMRAT